MATESLSVSTRTTATSPMPPTSGTSAGSGGGGGISEPPAPAHAQPTITKQRSAEMENPGTLPKPPPFSPSHPPLSPAAAQATAIAISQVTDARMLHILRWHFQKLLLLYSFMGWVAWPEAAAEAAAPTWLLPAAGQPGRARNSCQLTDQPPRPLTSPRNPTHPQPSPHPLRKALR